MDAHGIIGDVALILGLTVEHPSLYIPFRDAAARNYHFRARRVASSESSRASPAREKERAREREQVRKRDSIDRGGLFIASHFRGNGMSGNERMNT